MSSGLGPRLMPTLGSVYYVYTRGQPQVSAGNMVAAKFYMHNSYIVKECSCVGISQKLSQKQNGCPCNADHHCVHVYRIGYTHTSTTPTQRRLL